MSTKTQLCCGIIILVTIFAEINCYAALAQPTKNNNNNNNAGGININQSSKDKLNDFDLNASASISQKRLEASLARALTNRSTVEREVTVAKAGSCTTDDSDNPLNEFPEIFSEDELREGWVALHVFAAFYFFILLAVLCKNYFLPTVECICEDLNLSKDVAAATFMAMATSMPEFFTNTISVLITDSDMGLGTIIGSLIFNTLGVGGLAALSISKPVQLDWWPIARDCVLYGFNIVVLFAVAWGGYLTFTGSCIMMGFLVVYFLLSFNSERVMPSMRKFFEETLNCCSCACCRWNNVIEPTSEAYKPEKSEQNSVTTNGIDGPYTVATITDDSTIFANSQVNIINPDEKVAFKQPRSIFKPPTDKSKFHIFWWAFTFPIKFVLFCTVPNPITNRKWYPLSFIMCVIGIGLNAYMIVWMLTAFGVAIRVPQIVMGLTFLAAGSNMPEAVSSIVALRSGESGIGVSNSLGANSLAILMSLGIPWFIKNCMNYGKPDGLNKIMIAAQGIEFSITILLASTISLFIIFSFSGYRLTKKAGATMLLVYAILITTEILLEMNVFFPKNCD